MLLDLPPELRLRAAQWLCPSDFARIEACCAVLRALVAMAVPEQAAEVYGGVPVAEVFAASHSWPRAARFARACHGAGAAQRLAAGDLHTAVVAVGSGRAYSFGAGSGGRLGHGEGVDAQFVPLAIGSLVERGVRVVAVAAGREHTALVDDAGTLWTCGKESLGQLGHGAEAARRGGPRLTPKAVAALRRAPSGGGGVRVVAVAAGCLHTLALTDGGRVFSFGDGEVGQLGHGDTACHATPRAVEGLLAASFVTAIAAGEAHSAAVCDRGKCFTWGQGYDERMGRGAGGGRLGLGDDLHRNVPTLVSSLAGEKMGGLEEGGECEGKECEEKETEDENGTTEEGGEEAGCGGTKKVHVVGVSCGSEMTAIVSAAGALYTCGHGFGGLLGHGDEEDVLAPRRVAALCGHRVVSVSVGDSAISCLTDEGKVFTHGAGFYGQLGHGDGSHHRLPKQVTGALAGVRIVAIATGDGHAAAMSEAGRLFTWGYKSRGALGHGRPCDADDEHQLVPRELMINFD